MHVVESGSSTCLRSPVYRCPAPACCLSSPSAPTSYGTPARQHRLWSHPCGHVLFLPVSWTTPNTLAPAGSALGWPGFRNGGRHALPRRGYAQLLEDCQPVLQRPLPHDPAVAHLKDTIPAQLTALPVGGMPMNGPCCVPRDVIRAVTRSPSATNSSIVMCMSGKAPRNNGPTCLRMAGPRPLPTAPTISAAGSISSSTTFSQASLPWLVASRYRRTMALFSSVDMVEPPSIEGYEVSFRHSSFFLYIGRPACCAHGSCTTQGPHNRRSQHAGTDNSALSLVRTLLYY